MRIVALMPGEEISIWHFEVAAVIFHISSPYEANNEIIGIIAAVILPGGMHRSNERADIIGINTEILRPARRQALGAKSSIL